MITTSSFAGEGHRKVRAHLRREHQLHVGKNRVLRLMRNAGLLAPQRVARRRRPRVHDGRIITDAPNVRWGTDATMAWTRNDGWVWVFALLDHYTDEAWAHVAKVGNRFAALQPVYDAVIDRFGELGPDVARGIKLRHDWGSQYRSHHFQGSLNWLGIEDDAAFVGEPQGNGVAERFIRTIKEQCLWSRLFEDSTTSAKGSPPSSRPTTTSGSSNAWATGHHERRSSKRQLRLPRDSQGICPTNRGLNNSKRWTTRSRSVQSSTHGTWLVTSDHRLTRGQRHERFRRGSQQLRPREPRHHALRLHVVPERPDPLGSSAPADPTGSTWRRSPLIDPKTRTYYMPRDLRPTSKLRNSNDHRSLFL